MKKTIRFLITGVGGQGTILASDILAEVGLRLGHDAKKSDILGLAVRGGSVASPPIMTLLNTRALPISTASGVAGISRRPAQRSRMAARMPSSSG